MKMCLRSKNRWRRARKVPGVWLGSWESSPHAKISKPWCLAIYKEKHQCCGIGHSPSFGQCPARWKRYMFLTTDFTESWCSWVVWPVLNYDLLEEAVELVSEYVDCTGGKGHQYFGIEVGLSPRFPFNSILSHLLFQRFFHITWI